MERLPLSATLEQYEEQARELLRGHAAGQQEALRILHEHHPRFCDQKVRWLPLPLSGGEIQAVSLSAEDAQLALARWYSYRDWDALKQLVEAVTARDPDVYPFEVAAEAVIEGDLEQLAAMLRTNPELVHARSSRVTSQDPGTHRATLLHYIAANGVESYRQRTPSNAVAVARLLLEAGADPNATAHMYGGECTTLSMLVSSSPPHQAGVQVELVETLLDYGADPDGRGAGQWVNPLMTALVFGFRNAARALVGRGARRDRLSIAAGLGDVQQVEALLPLADAGERHRALALAAHPEIVRMLLDSGEDPDQYNPEAMHSHATPLHQAALAGNDAVVRMLVERGAKPDIRDKLWKSTPAGWAEHGGHLELANYLRQNESGDGF